MSQALHAFNGKVFQTTLDAGRAGPERGAGIAGLTRPPRRTNLRHHGGVTDAPAPTTPPPPDPVALRRVPQRRGPQARPQSRTSRAARTRSWTMTLEASARTSRSSSGWSSRSSLLGFVLGIVGAIITGAEDALAPDAAPRPSAALPDAALGGRARAPRRVPRASCCASRRSTRRTRPARSSRPPSGSPPSCARSASSPRSSSRSPAAARWSPASAATAPAATRCCCSRTSTSCPPPPERLDPRPVRRRRRRRLRLGPRRGRHEGDGGARGGRHAAARRAGPGRRPRPGRATRSRGSAATSCSPPRRTRRTAAGRAPAGSSTTGRSCCAPRARSARRAACRADVAGRRFYPIQVAEKGHEVYRIHVRGTWGHGSMPRDDNARGPARRRSSAASRRPGEPRITPVGAAAARRGRARRSAPDQRRLLAAATGDDPRRGEAALGALCDPIHARILRALIRDTISPDVIHAGRSTTSSPARPRSRSTSGPLPGTTPDDIREEILARLGDLVPACELEHDPQRDPVRDAGRRRCTSSCAGTIRAADPDGVPVPMMAPFATDGKHLVRLGVPVYGFSPLRLEPGEGFLDNFHSRRRARRRRGAPLGPARPVRRDRHLLRLKPRASCPEGRDASVPSARRDRWVTGRGGVRGDRARDRRARPLSGDGPGQLPPRTSRPRRLIACVASAATPIAMSARSPRGIGRTADRNCSARARSTIRSTAWPRGVSQTERCRAVVLLAPPLDEPPLDEPVDEPRRRGRRAPDRLGEVGDGRRASPPPGRTAPRAG